MKTLGVDYTEEIIASRIAGGSRPSRTAEAAQRKDQPAH